MRVLLLLLISTPAFAQTWEVRTLAGSRKGGGYADGIGADARFSAPSSAVACADAIYVADAGNHAIRRVTRDGVVTTYAGALAIAGNANGDRTNARFNLPSGITADAQCNLFVADRGNNAVRRIDASGAVTTIATGLRAPTDLALDGDGTIYVADAGSHTIRRIAPNGTVSIHAGTLDTPGLIDGTGESARFRSPDGITIDAAGNLYVAERINQTIRRVTRSRVVTTLLKKGYASDVAAAPDGTLYVANYSEQLIQRIDGSTYVDVAGASSQGGLVDATGSAARFNQPRGIAVDTDGTLIVVETINNTVRFVSTGGEVHTIAGSIAESGAIDGPGDVARFLSGGDLAIDANGIVFAGGGSAIRRIEPDGTVSTFVGSLTERDHRDGDVSTARFNGVGGIALAPNGDFIVADGNTIRRVTRDGNVTTIAGAPKTGGLADGIGSAARFQNTLHVAVANDGTIYVADASNSAIRKIVGNVVTTLNRTPSALPMGIDVDDEGNVYYWDENNPALFRVAPDGQRFEVVRDDRLFTMMTGLTRTPDGTFYLGGGKFHSIYRIRPGSKTIDLFAGGDESPGNMNGTAQQARFRLPTNLQIAPDGRLFVGDGNYAVRYLVRLRTRAAHHP